MHPSQLSHRVVAVLEEHPLVELLGAREAHRGVDGLIPTDVEIADELVDEQSAEALGASAVPGEERALDDLGQIHQCEHRSIEVREVATEDVRFLWGELLRDVGHNLRSYGPSHPRSWMSSHTANS